jgi:hypothetical protein
MCYAATVAESGGLDRRTMGFDPGSRLLRFPDRRTDLETAPSTAEVEL